jgi:PleD family two-component response regulator
MPGELNEEGGSPPARTETPLRILIVEDDGQIGPLMQRVLERAGHAATLLPGGLNAVQTARQIQPDVILLDLELPDISGMDVCRRLREDPLLSSVPVLIVTGQASLERKLEGFSLGADDYITKPFRAQELLARIDVIHRRARRNLEANPLTHLPGNNVIEREITARLSRGEKVSVLYCDIDRFKSYNDSYGFLQGDSAIRATALTILSCADGPRDFVGHIGGDDFVVVTAPDRAAAIASCITKKFDETSAGFYSLDDRARGYALVQNRRGEVEKAALMSLSVAIVENDGRATDHVARFSQAAAEIKRYLKSRPERRGSAFLKDRRHDGVPVQK